MTIRYDKERWRATHENGQIALSELAPISPQFFDTDLNGPAMMHPEAAAAASAMFAAARADGITELRVVYSYRTLATQKIKWANFQAGGNLAAIPGTSNHGWAVALDLGGLTDRALAWLRNNMRRFGFINDVSSENWHVTYQENIWNGEIPEEGDAELEKFMEGWRDYVAALKKHDGVDPGTAPDWPDEHRKFGWNAARFAANNPTPKR
jgi:hypothetical protein